MSKSDRIQRDFEYVLSRLSEVGNPIPEKLPPYLIRFILLYHDTFKPYFNVRPSGRTGRRLSRVRRNLQT